jgi:hypothetical protein
MSLWDVVIDAAIGGAVNRSPHRVQIVITVVCGLLLLVIFGWMWISGN